MSVFNEFDNLRNTVNRLFGDFDSGLRGRRGRFGGGGWDEGFGLGGGWPQTSLGWGGWGGSPWESDILDVPMLMGGGGWNQPSSWGGGWNQPLLGAGGGQQVGIGKGLEETKMEDVGGQQGGAGQQLMTKEPQAGTLMQTFRPSQIIRARVNVEDAGDKFIVTADMPGFDKQNLKVNVTDDGLLTIKGEQKKEHIDQAKDKRYLRAERTFANIHRTLRIPKGVDASKIAANYENGVLHVNLPKSPEAEKQKQDIQIQ